jgi:DNA-binding CsgD family transcriptional regulator
VLVGRHEEQRRIEDLLDAARQGASGALVLRGEAGVGKTALLDHAAATAKGMRVLRARGIESESELPFSGLLELLRPLLSHVQRLPKPQAAALEGALALEATRSNDPFAVYAGTLGLLTLAAEEGPVLALIDDAHWLDRGSAEALAFTSRRLGNEGIAMVWALREGEPTEASTEGLEELLLRGLEQEAALDLLAAAPVPMATEAAHALVELTNGNPLALLELPRLLTEAQREGLEPLGQPLPASPGLQQAFGRRLERLPADTRTMLVMAAASDSADVGPILRAWELAGLDLARLEPAEREGLVDLGGGRLEFRHPLIRATVYASADGAQRRKAHAILAEAVVDPSAQSRRAWHRALATVGLDETVAAELEATAIRAQAHTWHAAARALERAARLTPAETQRARRLLAAAKQWQVGGRSDVVQRLLDEATSLSDESDLLAAAEHLLGRIAWSARGDARRAVELLERAAGRVGATDPEQAALMLADAAEPLAVAGELDHAEQTTKHAWELGRKCGGSVELWTTLRHADVLAWRGSVERATELWLHAAEIPSEDLAAASAVGEALFSAGEDERAREALRAAIETARATSSLGVLAYALGLLGLVEARRGRLAAAAAAAAEAHELAIALGQLAEAFTALTELAWIEALLGRERDCRRHLEEARALRHRLGQEPRTQLGEGTLCFGLGRFDEAIENFEAYARQIGSRIGADAIAPRSFVPNLVEAYVRVGRIDPARAALEAYAAFATRSGRPHALALALRCRALVEGELQDFEAALAEHGRWDNPFERARTELVYGEFLRRRKLRAEARAQLRAALLAFEAVGAVVWADRARTELRATGERARRRQPSTRDELTPQELNVARLVCEGLTNREIAERLFLSPKTIESHLVRIFRKTDVRSRTELTVALAGSEALVS